MWLKNLKNRKRCVFCGLPNGNIFRHIYLYYYVETIPSYHRMQFQRKLMIQTQENGKKPSKTAKICGFCGLPNRNIFFLKIGLRHFSPLTSEQLHAKNLRNPMMGSMRILRYGLTDGAGFIGPVCGSKKSFH